MQCFANFPDPSKGECYFSTIHNLCTNIVALVPIFGVNDVTQKNIADVIFPMKMLSKLSTLYVKLRYRM